MEFNRDKFFDLFRQHFGALAQEQVDGLNFLLSAIEKEPLWDDLRHIAYLLSTIKHETAHRFQPINEYGGDSYFRKYDGRDDLGNNVAGDGLRFKGRGFAQITGRRNYTKFSKLLNLDLVNNPRSVLNPEIAFKIITLGMHRGLFTGKKLSDYINDTVCDYVNARKIINGLDKANTLAGYAKRFYQILRSAKVKDFENLTESEINKSANSLPQKSDSKPRTNEQAEVAEPEKTSASPQNPTAGNGAQINEPVQAPEILPEAKTEQPVDVQQVQPEKTSTFDEKVNWFSAKLLAIPAGVSTFLLSIGSWITSSPLTLTLTLIGIAALITVVYIVLYLWLKNKREAREAGLAADREKRAHEIQLAVIQAAASKDMNTVRLVPPVIPNSEN